MRVVTLGNKELDSACASLSEKIINDCEPIAIIGILNGGSVVARLVYTRLLNSMPGLKYFDVSASRSLSIAKKKVNIARLFGVMPLSLLNILRVIEHYYLRMSMLFIKNPGRHVQLNESLVDYIGKLSDGCVCIIDDAIDSGATVNRVTCALKDINSRLNYKVAVLVVTQDAPLTMPDIVLYRDVLIRFPWSNDCKQ